MSVARVVELPVAGTAVPTVLEPAMAVAAQATFPLWAANGMMLTVFRVASSSRLVAVVPVPVPVLMPEVGLLAPMQETIGRSHGRQTVVVAVQGVLAPQASVVAVVDTLVVLVVTLAERQV
jgi:hypothetical protein